MTAPSARFRLRPLPLAILGALLGSAAARAQVLPQTAAPAPATIANEAPPPAPGSAARPGDTGTTLAPVSVTARGDAVRAPDETVERKSRGSALFGDADLRSVPMTVNVITDAEIANRQARTLGDALMGDPAVVNDYGGTGGYPTESFNIRGFQLGGGDAFLKDGMPMAGQVTQGTENIEQIEVVRGPVGFRYGYLPPGGAINLVSKRPTAVPLRSLTLSTDRYGSAKAHADLGGRFGTDAQFGYRVNLMAEHAKLFFEPVERKRTLVAVALDWRANAGNTVTLSYDRNHFRSGPDLFHYTIPDVNGHEIAGTDPRRFWGQTFLPDGDFLVESGSLGWESRLTDHLTLNTRFSLYRNDGNYNLTIPTAAQPNGDYRINVSKSHNISLSKANTTYLQWKGDAGLPQTLTLGASWQHETMRRQGAVSGPLLLPNGQPAVSNFFAPVQFQDTTAKVEGPYSPWLDRQQGSGFLSDEIRVADRWRLLLALRTGYMRDNSPYRARPGRTSSTDPTLGLMFDVTPQLMTYASYATGLEQGGIAPATAVNAFAQMPAVKSTQVELGAKADLSDGALTLDGALFRIQKSAEFTNTANEFVQDGREIHSGAEVRLNGRVHPLVSLSTGLQFLHGTFTGSPATEGSRPMNVPRLHATFSGDFRVPQLPGLTFTSGLYYTGEREVNVPNLPAKAPAYTRLDAGLRYETRVAGTDVIARFNIENLTNRRYYAVGWYSLYEPGAPRTASASLQMKF